jgi:pilus assembly protein Flp/PilA
MNGSRAGIGCFDAIGWLPYGLFAVAPHAAQPSKHQQEPMSMLKNIQKFLRDEEGASAVEYGLIVGLIAVVIVGVLTSTGTSLSTLFTKISDSLGTAATR